MSMGFAAARMITSATSLSSAPPKHFGHGDDAALRRPYLPPHYRAERHRSRFRPAFTPRQSATRRTASPYLHRQPANDGKADSTFSPHDRVGQLRLRSRDMADAVKMLAAIPRVGWFAAGISGVRRHKAPDPAG